jgi:hypothetical protein
MTFPKFLELDGENEACEVDSVEKNVHVTIVNNDQMEVVDSDEDEADEWQPPALNAEQAFASARMLKEFMFS